MKVETILLIISTLITILLLRFINKKTNKNQMVRSLTFGLITILIWDVALILQSTMAERFNMNPIYFDYIAYVGICFLPISVFFIGIVFTNTKIKFSKKYLLLIVVPIISLIMLWTNDFHNLFYVQYSTNIDECVYGSYMIVHNIYTYSLIFIGIYKLLNFSIKNSGLFSKQSMLIVAGISIPIIVNVLGALKIFSMTIYLTPITFTITLLCFTFAIFRFNFLSVAPIALRKIVDRISDSYVVISEDFSITDYNRTFIKTFQIKNEKNMIGSIFQNFLKEQNLYLNLKKIEEEIVKIKDTQKVASFELYVRNINKYFNVELATIISNGESLGTLILFKDITQHKQDIQIIKDNQEQLMEKERLSSLGQLVGGIAHNLKTPIMSISGAAEGISDLIKEYESSIGDPEVTIEDHHEIASDMMEWISKIKTHTEYMSDIITAVKGQAVALSEDTDMTFTIDELIKRVNILMKHELKNAIIYLNNIMKVDKDLELKGDVNSLVQVINNMVSNAIQAYDGKPEQNIDMIVSKENNNIIISIKDYAGGLPKGVKDKLFKEMVTTKGKNGTGLGLYMSYSNIRAHFGGNITAESEEGKGTTFNIILPIQK